MAVCYMVANPWFVPQDSLEIHLSRFSHLQILFSISVANLYNIMVSRQLVDACRLSLVGLLAFISPTVFYLVLMFFDDAVG